MNRHLTFYHFLIDDKKDKEYNPTLPFGGIRKDAPELCRKQYSKFLREWEEIKKKSVSEGISLEEAERELYRYHNWKKVMITRPGSGAWRKYRQLLAEGMSKEDAIKERVRIMREYEEETQHLLHKYDSI